VISIFCSAVLVFAFLYFYTMGHNYRPPIVFTDRPIPELISRPKFPLSYLILRKIHIKLVTVKFIYLTIALT